MWGAVLSDALQSKMHSHAERADMTEEKQIDRDVALIMASACDAADAMRDINRTWDAYALRHVTTEMEKTDNVLAIGMRTHCRT